MGTTRLTAGLSLVLVLVLLMLGCQQKNKTTAETAEPAAGSAQAPAETADGGSPAPKDTQVPAPASAWTGNAKDFSYRDPSGKVHKLSEHAGKPIVVDFWAVW